MQDQQLSMKPTLASLWPRIRFSAAQQTFLKTIICDFTTNEIVTDSYECLKHEYRTAKALADRGILSIDGAKGDEFFEVRLTHREVLGKVEAKILDAVRAIRKEDCGGWLADGENGRQKRVELMKLLDQLYKACGLA